LHSALAEILQADAPPVSLLTRFRGEILYVTLMSEKDLQIPLEPDSMATDESDERLLPEGVTPKTALQAFRARALQHFTEAFEEARKCQTILEANNRFADVLERPFERQDPTRVAMGAFLPPLRGAGQSFLRSLAQRRAFQGLVNALAYRMREGRFPTSVQEMGFTLLDPFTDQPVRFRETNGGILVYSVGPDKVDQQVRERGEPGPSSDDVSARFPHVAVSTSAI